MQKENTVLPYDQRRSLGSLLGTRNIASHPLLTKYFVQHRIYDRLVAFLENRSTQLIPDGRGALELEVTRDAPGVLYRQLVQAGQEELLFKARIVEVPRFLVNALCCEELKSEFGLAEVLMTDGFTLRGSILLLDVDQKWARTGFMIPIYKNGIITGLKVFRRPSDDCPFRLRTRPSVRRSR